jgi:hypothetical protein
MSESHSSIQKEQTLNTEKLWAVIFKPGPVAENIEWSFRVKGLGFTLQQI